MTNDLEGRVAALEAELAALRATPSPSPRGRGRPATHLLKALAFMAARDNVPAFSCEIVGAVGGDERVGRTVRTSIGAGWAKYLEPAGEPAIAPSGFAARRYRLTARGLERAGRRAPTKTTPEISR